MKRNLKPPLLFTFLVTMLLTMAPSARAEECSLAGAAGKYAFTLTGTLLTPAGPVPVAAVGKAILDAEGNVSGTEGPKRGWRLR